MEKLLRKIGIILCTLCLTIGVIVSSTTGIEAATKYKYTYKFKTDISVSSTDATKIDGPYKVYIDFSNGDSSYIGTATRTNKLSSTYKLSLTTSTYETNTKNVSACIRIVGTKISGNKRINVPRKTSYKPLKSGSTVNLNVRGSLTKDTISM